MEKPFSAYKGDGPYVFVCYAHEDSEAVFREIGWLNDYGVNVWYDEGIGPGHEWREELASAIQGCTRMLFFVTPRSVVSEHCRRELNFAQEESREVVAIHLEPTEMPAGLRLGLNNRQAVLKHELDEGEFHKRLMRAVHGGTGPTVRQVPASGGRPQWRRAGIALAGVALVLTAVGTWWFMQRDVAPADAGGEAAATADEAPARDAARNSIAVLPFVNMSSDVEQEYFSDGLSEEVLNLLAKNPELKVISRSSAFTFKGKDVDIRTVAQRLGVAHVLEGSVRKAGNRVRVTAQLIDAETDTHLWSETYDRELDDIFAIQDEIANKVAQALNLTLFGDVAKRTDNLDAYTLYLQARHLRLTLAPENLEPAEAMLKRALALEPTYAEAWIELAVVYQGKGGTGIMPNAQASRLASEAIERARQLDPESAAVYAALSFSAMFEDRDLARAAEYIKRGVSLEPTNLRVIEAAAILALNLGRLDDAETLEEYVVAHDPLCANCFGNLGGIYLLQEKLDEAADAFETVEMLGGAAVGGDLMAALLLLLQGKHEASLARWEQYAVPGPFRVYGEAITLYSMGREAAFAVKFQELKDQYGADYPTMVARVYAWTGDADSAFEWLDRYRVAHPERGPIIGNFWELLSVELKSLHQDPRWHEHLERLGIAPEQLAKFEFDIPLPK